MPDLRDLLDKEREKSDKAYAAKIIERIVLGFLGLLAASIIGALVNLLFNHIK